MYNSGRSVFFFKMITKRILESKRNSHSKNVILKSWCKLFPLSASSIIEKAFEEFGETSLKRVGLT